MPRMVLWSVLVIAAGPLVIAVLGCTHPYALLPETAAYWRQLHVLLLPLFPLLAVNLWWLLARESGVIPWLARSLGLVYAAFYTALDVLAGIGAGALVAAGTSPLDRTTRELFSQGNALAAVGVWAFLVAAVLTGGALTRRHGLSVLPGALILILSAFAFTHSHVYFPYGVATMLAMGIGFGWLQWVRLRDGSTAPAGR